jgi:hypothetical protein
MDIRRHARGSLLVLVLAILASAGAHSRPMNEGVRLVGGTSTEQGMVRWALERYQAAGLELPPVEVHFHPDPTGCGDNSGFYRGGRLDVCITGQAEPYARKVVVHELAHAWSEASLTAEDRERFLGLRDLPTWNSWGEPWGMRGCEQAAEIITWGVTGGAVTVLVPTDDAPEQLQTAYDLLTRHSPPGAASLPTVLDLVGVGGHGLEPASSSLQGNEGTAQPAPTARVVLDVTSSRRRIDARLRCAVGPSHLRICQWR